MLCCCVQGRFHPLSCIRERVCPRQAQAARQSAADQPLTLWRCKVGLAERRALVRAHACMEGSSTAFVWPVQASHTGCSQHRLNGLHAPSPNGVCDWQDQPLASQAFMLPWPRVRSCAVYTRQPSLPAQGRDARLPGPSPHISDEAERPAVPKGHAPSPPEGPTHPKTGTSRSAPAASTPHSKHPASQPPTLLAHNTELAGLHALRHKLLGHVAGCVAPPQNDAGKVLGCSHHDGASGAGGRGVRPPAGGCKHNRRALEGGAGGQLTRLQQHRGSFEVYWGCVVDEEWECLLITGVASPCGRKRLPRLGTPCHGPIQVASQMIRQRDLSVGSNPQGD